MSLQFLNYDINMPQILIQFQSTSPDPSWTIQIKDLGLLTHIFRESATRRFLWCSSKLLTPWGRRDMSETVFLPTGRIWLESLEIILHKTCGWMQSSSRKLNIRVRVCQSGFSSTNPLSKSNDHGWTRILNSNKGWLREIIYEPIAPFLVNRSAHVAL